MVTVILPYLICYLGASCPVTTPWRAPRALRWLNTSNAMLQRGAHALLFLMCSPLLVRCEDVRLASEPTHPRAIAHAQVH